jgi:hypothetical protein
MNLLTLFFNILANFAQSFLNEFIENSHFLLISGFFYHLPSSCFSRNIADSIFKIHSNLSDEFLKEQMEKYLIFNFPFWNDKFPEVQLYIYQKCIPKALKGRKDNKLIHRIFYSLLFDSIIKVEIPTEFSHFGFYFNEASNSFVSSSEINSKKWSIILSLLHSESDFIIIFFQALAFTSNPFLVHLLCGENSNSPSLMGNSNFSLEQILGSQNLLSCIIHSFFKLKSIELIASWHSICQQVYYNPNLSDHLKFIQSSLHNLIFSIRSQELGSTFLSLLISFSFGCSSIHDLKHQQNDLIFPLYIPIIFANIELVETIFN